MQSHNCWHANEAISTWLPPERATQWRYFTVKLTDAISVPPPSVSWSRMSYEPG